jgi:hypothetical protein
MKIRQEKNQILGIGPPGRPENPEKNRKGPAGQLFP